MTDRYYHPMKEALDALLVCREECGAREGNDQVLRCWEALNAGECPKELKQQ